MLRRERLRLCLCLVFPTDLSSPIWKETPSFGINFQADWKVYLYGVFWFFFFFLSFFFYRDFYEVSLALLVTIWTSELLSKLSKLIYSFDLSALLAELWPRQERGDSIQKAQIAAERIPDI